MAMSDGAQALKDQIDALPAEIDAYTQAAVAKGRQDLQAEHDEDIEGLGRAFDAVKAKITPAGQSASDAGAAAASQITGSATSGATASSTAAGQGGAAPAFTSDADDAAYASAQANGYTGTFEEWVAASRPTGPVQGA